MEPASAVAVRTLMTMPPLPFTALCPRCGKVHWGLSLALTLLPPLHVFFRPEWPTFIVKRPCCACPLPADPVPTDDGAAPELLVPATDQVPSEGPLAPVELLPHLRILYVTSPADSHSWQEPPALRRLRSLAPTTRVAFCGVRQGRTLAEPARAGAWFFLGADLVVADGGARPWLLQQTQRGHWSGPTVWLPGDAPQISVDAAWLPSDASRPLVVFRPSGLVDDPGLTRLVANHPQVVPLTGPWDRNPSFDLDDWLPWALRRAAASHPRLRVTAVNTAPTARAQDLPNRELVA